MAVFRFRRKYRYTQIGIGLLITCALALWKHSDSQPRVQKLVLTENHAGRHLMSAEDLNCTPRAIAKFPHDPFTADQREHGAIVVHVFIACYMFLGFALLCDDYFVPSLEVLCDVFHIQSDVAGATFMAAGSSAPELATAIIAVFIAEDDIGIGTVVGSAVYNVMFVISMCALFAGTVVHLNWWPLVRDCIFYALSVGALAIVIIDEKVYWYEAVSFVVLYFFYILLMYFNSTLETWIVPKFSCCNNFTPLRQSESTTLLFSRSENGVTIKANGTLSKETSLSTSHGQIDNTTESESDFEDELNTEMPLVKKEGKDKSVDSPESVFKFPDACWKRAIYVWALPLKVVFFVSIPDCRQLRWRRWFIVTFLMSLVWLSALSYLMVWMITVIGYTAGIADTIMGLTFIAFGVSLPDVIASLLVVREGLGDMAVSNAVGSNVFDILVCLGVPWCIQTFLHWGTPVKVYSQGMLYATITLLVTVVFLLVATHINKWRLTKKFGVILMIVYVGFTALTALYELNIFGYVHPPECQYNY